VKTQLNDLTSYGLGSNAISIEKNTDSTHPTWMILAGYRLAELLTRLTQTERLVNSNLFNEELWLAEFCPNLP
jgi:hypothetical protein